MDYRSAWVKRLLTNICVIGGPLVTGLMAVSNRLPDWVAIVVVVLSIAIKQWQSHLDLEAPAK